MSYTPTIPPVDASAIPAYLTTELQALAQSLLQSQPYALLQTLNVAPVRPREGLIVKADGTHWNPGSGAGVYGYIGGAWVKFSGGGGGGVTTVTGTSPVVSSGGTTPAISLLGLSGLGSPLQVVRTNAAGTALEYAAPSGGITAGTGDVTFSGTGSVATTIALGNRHEWTATQNVAQVALTDAASITPNGALSNQFYLLTTSAVGGTRTINLPSSLNPGDFVNFEIKQPSSGGPCVVVWAAGYKWGQGGQGSAPVISTVASASDFFSFTVQADGNLHGGMIGQAGSTGPGYAATSTTSLTPGTGSKALATQLGLAYSAGCRARATSASTGDYFEGPVASYNSSGVLTITADAFSGSTARTDWNINVAGSVGVTGGQGIPGPAGLGNGVNIQSGTSYTVVSGDASKLLVFTNAGAVTVTVPQATGSFASPFKFSVRSRSAGVVTMTPTTSTVDGVASIAYTNGQGADWSSDGTNWDTQQGAGSGGGGSSFSTFDITWRATTGVMAELFTFALNGLSQCRIDNTAATARGTKSLVVGAADVEFEIQCDGDSSAPGVHMIGVCTSAATRNNYVGSDAFGWGYYANSGSAYHSGSSAAFGATYNSTNNDRDIIGVRIDTSGHLIYKKNGVVQGTAFTITPGTVIYPAYSSAGGGLRAGILNTGAVALAFPTAGVGVWG